MLSRHRVATVLLAAAVLLPAVAPATGAQAQADCQFISDTDPAGNEILVWTCRDGWSGGEGDGEWVCATNLSGRDIRVPCIDEVLGWFTDSLGGCYIRPAIPQPPADDPVWDGHDPTEGLVYSARCFAADEIDGLPYVQLPTTLFFPAGEGPVGDLVERAIALLPLRGADIHLAPDPAGVGLVGLPVWMWTPVTESTWGPATASLTALGITVSVEASAEHISWAMGDGNQVRCDQPGEPYQPAYGADDSPTCGHRYAEPSRSRPDGRYPITATTQWRIEWWIEETVIGGTVPATRESASSVRINELQVVTS